MNEWAHQRHLRNTEGFTLPCLTLPYLTGQTFFSQGQEDMQAKKEDEINSICKQYEQKNKELTSSERVCN